MRRLKQHTAPRLLLMLSAICLLVACDDERSADQNAAHKKIASERAAAPEWLELKDETDPVTWLIERSKASGRSLSSEDGERLRMAISVAVLRLGESARMIANRAVQLEVMLAAEGQDERAETLVPLLTDTIGETGQTEGFGAVSQHYFNMRKAGRSSKEAVADLRLRYGPRS